MTDKPNEPPKNVQPIRKQNSALAKKFRDIANALERGRVHGIFMITVDEHRRPELSVMVEKFAVTELLGMIELELFVLKADLHAQLKRPKPK